VQTFHQGAESLDFDTVAEKTCHGGDPGPSADPEFFWNPSRALMLFVLVRYSYSHILEVFTGRFADVARQ